MKICCGHAWGIWWWRTSGPATRVTDFRCGLTSLEDCRTDMAVLKAAGIEHVHEMGVSRGIPSDVPVDVVSATPGGHQGSRLCSRYCCSTSIPSGSLCQIADGVYVFAPAFCILQVAAIVTRLHDDAVPAAYRVVIVANLCCEMCGQYSLSAAGRGFVKREPLVTISELAQLVLDVPGAYGGHLLRAALSWTIERLRSPKETATFLLLCLPVELGGFGLPRPLSNFDIDVSWVQEGYFATWPSCNVDLYWGYARLVVEYDSREYHDDLGQQKLEDDERRAEALRALGYTVVTIRHDDLYGARRFREKAEEIADALHRELPPPSGSFIEANKVLRKMLLLHDPWV